MRVWGQVRLGKRPLMAAIGGVVAAGLMSAGALAATFWEVQPSPDPGGSYHDNDLLSVAGTSTSNAWAVGYYNNGTASQTLIGRWNGTRWNLQPGANPSSSLDELYGVTATSPTNAWAVGYDLNGAAARTLIEHWGGQRWQVQTSPSPGSNGGDNSLVRVAATSPTNAWAVGYYSNSNATNALVKTLIEHWDGKEWKIQASPSPGPYSYLVGVAATSATNAWAVGYRSNSSLFSPTVADQTLIEHWNGTKWTVLASPDPGGSGTSDLFGVAATSATNAWAVGDYSRYNNRTADKTLIERWNGKVWKVQPSPNLSSDNNDLADVTATSATNAWAVGRFYKAAESQTLIERWDGKTWTVQPSPSLSSEHSYYLSGVAATSSTNAWAVGSSQYYVAQTLIEHR